MIYVDVTAACLLRLETGIPRTTRGMYRVVRETMPEVMPIFWQPFRGGYTQLSARAQKLLAGAAVFESGAHAPRDSTFPLLWASFCDLGSWPQAVPLLREIGRNDTLLLTSLFPDNRLAYLQRLANGPGRKIAIFHDAIPLRDANVSGWEKRRHLQTLKLLAKMDLVIAVSQAAGEDLQALWREHGMAAAPTALLPWPVPFTAPRPAFSEPSSGPKRILYVSRLKQVKNHTTLLAACEKLWREGLSFALDLIGCEDEARESRAVLAEVARLQRAGRSLTWRAQVTEDELHEAYRRARFTVFPSVMEGFGLPVVESLWHGRPVICSGGGAVGELARDGGCLTTDVRNPDALAATIRELLQDETACLAWSKRAYARPVRTWADYGRELKTLLENR